MERSEVTPEDLCPETHKATSISCFLICRIYLDKKNPYIRINISWDICLQAWAERSSGKDFLMLRKLISPTMTARQRFFAVNAGKAAAQVRAA
jgi:hypothetical protein